jgi:tryptophan-rich sensory protein
MSSTYLLHIVVPIIFACILNAIIYSQGWNRNQGQMIKKNILIPPGYVIAIIWIILLGLLGYAHYLTYSSYVSWIIVGAILYCLLYPFLTNGLKEDQMKLYNGLALVFAMLVFVSIYLIKKQIIIYSIPFLLWTIYVYIVTNLDSDSHIF